MTREQWDGELYAALEALGDMTRSDAQGVADVQPFIVAQAWGRGDTPAQCAALVLAVALC